MNEDDEPATTAAQACGATWFTSHTDPYYGLSATCDQAPEHDGDHAGAVRTWDGDTEFPQGGVRLSWPLGVDSATQEG